MSRQQKRQQREADILTATIKLLDERSFLDLRMSDIAKAADCSMGAIYSHFSSKEDLLLGCADAIFKMREPVKKRIFQLDLPPHERMVLMCFCLWYSDDQYPGHYRLQQLAMNPFVWERASSQRYIAINEFSNEMYSWMKVISKELLEQHPTLDYSEELALELELGLFACTWGLFQIKESGFEVFNKVLSPEKSYAMHKRQIKRFFTSWDIYPDNFDERLSALEVLTRKLVQEELLD
ncbi:TetR/AcrR family transcriptional regulator [Endozoicomonas gorgoniicola]|uniref:TetR/AcrR family transcriptional regulator n=1 Tax=Endozoicomonas gorgoniicola TaxID=1234144 RepID=A0ABT3MP10_9GAMM|nr:TetR/AcrR family transcriptional regulator [Endozoicomonas gorgoniicola]MCW7551104.1 TetR/AcrR family transcriptional regulator [Endozoicomonas gorgoniicola]